MAVLYQKDEIAVYDDSILIDHVDRVGFGLKATMKALRHQLKITVEGPDNLAAAVERCIAEATIAAALVLVGSAFMGAGLAAIGPAKQAFEQVFFRCVGNIVQVRFDDNSHWHTWQT